MLSRFGSLSEHRKQHAQTLTRIYRLAIETGHLERFIVFGSFVTAKLNPNDIDVILVMDSAFNHLECTGEMLVLLDHSAADREFNASVFWIRSSHLIGETADEFVEYWQTKRGGGQRGIVEVIP